MAQLLERSGLDTEQKNCVRILEAAGQTMLVLLSDVLHLSKIEAGRFELIKAPFVLAELVDNVADTFRMLAKNKGLKLRVEPLPENLPTLVGDAMSLSQVLGNLVGNAIKFTSEGEVSISAAVFVRSADSLRVRFAVRDSGIGVAEENIGKLFEPFVQADKTTYRKFGGTGLGLALSKRLIQLMGGMIGVESTLGRGSEFWFVVPFALGAAADPKRPRQAGGDHSEKQLAGTRILVVDDVETNRDIAAKLLSFEGAQCESVDNGRAAVERLRATPHDFDLVLMDVQMPVMDGLEATRAIRGELGLVDLPVIALTAGAMESQRELALAAGMNGFIAKPFRLKEMVSALTPLLRRDSTG